MLFWAPGIDIGRLFTFSNFSGDAGGGVWPTAFQSIFFVFVLGLLQGVYTVTGFDASGHTSEETRNAAREVPKGMIRSVWWSFLFGYVMVCSFVLAMPTVEEGAAQGWNSFNWLIGQHPMPYALKVILAIIIVVSNFLCALAGLTSCSRMMFAFARDGGLPFAGALRHVSVAYRTPVNAIWVGAVLSIIATLYGGVFWVLATACAVFLYISYVMCCAAGLWSEINGTWTKKGPFSLGGASKLVALVAIVGCLILIFVGVQPPNQKVGYLIVAMIVVGIVLWFAFEKNRFQGPPVGERIAQRQAAIAAEEKAVGEAAV